MKFGMNKTKLGQLSFLAIGFSLLIFAFSLAGCRNPAGDEESGDMGTFTIDLGGTEGQSVIHQRALIYLTLGLK